MMKVFSVFDNKAAAYVRLIEAPTAAIAVRTFSDACKEPGGPLGKHPQDYSLCELGEWDQATGLITSLQQPRILITASSVIAELVREERRRQPELAMPGLSVREAAIVKEQFGSEREPLTGEAVPS